MIVTSAILFGLVGVLFGIAGFAIAIAVLVNRKFAEDELRKSHRRDARGRFVKLPLEERDPIMREQRKAA